VSTNTTGITAAMGISGEIAGMQHKTAMKSKYTFAARLYCAMVANGKKVKRLYFVVLT
jgi:hypothetical protein